VAQQLLHDFHVLTIRMEQSGIGSSERVPTNLFANADLPCRRVATFIAAVASHF